jgi:type I restriction enzyme S subunit
MSDLPNGKALAKTFIVDADDKYTLNQRIGGILVKNNNEILPKFLYYFLNRSPQLLKHDNGADQTNLRKDQILNIRIPVFKVERQACIVAILDQFDTLTHSMTEGLPREIALRQQQYEHYRDLLLSFPKPLGAV